MTITEPRDGNNLKCTFGRNVIEVLYSFWLEIFRVSFYHPSVEADEIIWEFSTKGVYSSQSLYKIVNLEVVPNYTLYPFYCIVW